MIIIVEHVCSNFSSGTLSTQDASPKTLATQFSNKVSRVIWSKWFLVVWFENSYYFPGLVLEEVSARGAIFCEFRFDTLEKSHFNILQHLGNLSWDILEYAVWVENPERVLQLRSHFDNENIFVFKIVMNESPSIFAKFQVFVK